MIRAARSVIQQASLACVVSIAATCGAVGAQPSQRSFASAKEAAGALVAALDANDPAQLDALFGPAFARFEPTDKVAAAADRQQLAEAARQTLFLREDGSECA